MDICFCFIPITLSRLFTCQFFTCVNFVATEGSLISDSLFHCLCDFLSIRHCASFGIECRQCFFRFSCIFITRASFRRVSFRPSVRLSVTSRSSTETANVVLRKQRHTIAQGLDFLCRKSRQNSNGVISNGGTKCRWGRLNAGVVAENLATFDAKRCQLSSVASLSQ